MQLFTPHFVVRLLASALILAVQVAPAAQAKPRRVEPSVPMAATGSAAVGHSPSPTAARPVVGAVWSLTGSAAAYGTSQREGAELAHLQLSAGGAVPFDLVTLDDASTPDGSVHAVGELIGKHHVTALLGPTLSSGAKAALPLAQAADVVVLGVSNTVSGVVELGDCVFRDSLPENVLGPNTLEVAHGKLGFTRVAVLYGDDDDYTRGDYDVFKTTLAVHGLQTVAVQTFQRGQKDFSAALSKVKESTPDAIILSAFVDEAALILVQARQLGIPAPVRFIGGSGLITPVLIEKAGAAAEGLLAGAAWHVDSPVELSVAFVRAFKDRFGHAPDQFAAQSYTGVRLLATALEKPGVTLKQGLAGLRDVPTVLGSFSFDDSRNPVHVPCVLQVKDGRFVPFP